MAVKLYWIKSRIPYYMTHETLGDFSKFLSTSLTLAHLRSIVVILKVNESV